MKRFLLGLALSLFASGAWAQCTGVFPANTLCGNLSATAAPPSAFSASGTIVGPASSTISALAVWGNTLGTQLKDASNSTVVSNYTWSGTQTFLNSTTFNVGSTFNGAVTISPSTISIGGANKTFPAGATTIGGLATTQVWTGGNTFTGTTNLSGTAQLNGGSITTVLGDANVLNNCSISATAASNNLTVTLKDGAGADPSGTSPCTIAFRSATAISGTYSNLAITAGISLTAPNGASLGTANATPARVWVVAFNDAGVPRLGLYQSITFSGTTPTNLTPLDDAQIASSTAIGAGSTSAATFYTSPSVSAKPLRILGWINFNAGQATAGTWATAPDKIQLFGPGIRKSGETVQKIRAGQNAAASTASTYTPSATLPTTSAGATAISAVSFSGKSPVDLLSIRANVFGGSGTGNTAMTGYVAQGISVVAIGGQTGGVGTGINSIPLSALIMVPSAAGAISASTYAGYVIGTNASSSNAINGGVAALWTGVSISTLDLEEIEP